jgi:hypothetical protein
MEPRFEIPEGPAFGVSLLRGDQAAVVRVLRDDYEYLARNPDFISGTLLESTVEPGRFFHITRWRTPDAFAEAREDPEIRRILDALPAGTFESSHPSVALLVAHDGYVTARDPGGATS